MAGSASRRFGRYELVRPLGHGAMGEVHKAILHGPVGFRKLVALKVLFPSFGELAEHMRQDMVKEARVGAMLRHPNVVETYELGEAEDRLYIAMELVEGPPLRTLLQKSGGLSPRAIVQIAEDACRGLHHAHRLKVDGRSVGLVHRDLKPSNILLDLDGTAKIADFGLATAAGFSPGEREGISGTPAYMSPEQVRGEELDARSDIFSLGLVLYELVCGRRLFHQFSPIVTMLRVQEIDSLIDESLEPVRARQPGLETLLRKALRHDPDERFATAREFLEALRGLPEQAGADLLSILQEGELGLYDGLLGSGADSGEQEEAEERTEAISMDRIPEPVLPPLLGREKLIEAAVSSIQSGRRLVTLKGGAGMGKSAMAQRVAVKLRAAGRSVAEVDLHGISSLEDFFAVLTRQLGLRLAGKEEGPGIEELGEALSVAEDTVVVLDGADGLVSQLPAPLASWRSLAPRIGWLVVSRVLLQFPDEEIIEVPPLSLEDSRRILETLSRERGLDWPALNADAALMNRLLHKLDGIPLAIEIAAAQLAVHSPEEILGRLASGGEGQHPIQEAISLSWGLLRPWEQTALLQLSVCDGGFLMDAAEAVVDLSGFQRPPWIMEVVGALLDHSLLHAEVQNGEARFSMLDSVRAFASTRLLGGERSDAERRHARHYAKWALSPKPAPRFDWAGYWLQREREAGNFLAAMRASNRNRWSLLTAQNGICLARCWQVQGAIHKGRKLLSSLLSLSGLTNREQAQINLLQGTILRQSGEYASSVESLQEALICFASLGDRQGQADALRSLALSYGDRGDLVAAQASIGRSIAIAKDCGDVRREALGRKDQGYLLSQVGRPEEAIPILESAGRTLRLLNDLPHASQVMSSLGLIAFRRNQPYLAGKHYKVALRLGESAGMANRLGMTWMNLGLCFLLQGQPEPAEKSFRKAEKRLKRMGSYRALALLYANLGMLRLSQNDHVAAGRYTELSESLCQRYPHAITEHTMLVVKAQLLVQQLDFYSAMDSVERALGLVRKFKLRYKEAETMALYAETIALCGELPRARSVLSQADSLARESSDEAHLFAVACVRGQIACLDGDMESASAALEEARTLADGSLGLRPDVRYQLHRLYSQLG